MNQKKKIIIEAFKDIQNHICSGLYELTNQNFEEDKWKYSQGEGGVITRIFSDGLIEKGGVNFSSLSGNLSEKIGKNIIGKGAKFFATGVSLVIHPENPFIPTIHMNIRYIERNNKCWFGGGIDLTPFYIENNDIINFHLKLKNICDKHSVGNYTEFKKQCDDYFFIKHRNEARGVGGIFFDYLEKNFDQTFNFVKDVGYGFNEIYFPIFKNKKNKKFSTNNKKFQLYRRGRYVEFNLVYDRGTLFGLETNGRIESILMSLPPLTSWKYNWKPIPNSEEEKLYKQIIPRDWISS